MSYDDVHRLRSLEADLRERAWRASMSEDTGSHTEADAARYERERAIDAGEGDDRPTLADLFGIDPDYLGGRRAVCTCDGCPIHGGLP